MGYKVEEDGALSNFEVPLSFLERHTFVTGSTGSGKTVLCKALVEEVIAKTSVPVFAVDVQGDVIQLAKPGEITPSGSGPIEASREKYFGRVAVAIFTPGSSTGLKLSLDPCHNLVSLVGTQEVNPDEVRSVIGTISSTIVGLLNVRGQANDVYTFIVYRILLQSYDTGVPIQTLYDLKNHLTEEDLELDKDFQSHVPKLKMQLELLLSGPNSVLFPEDGVPLTIDLLTTSPVEGKSPLFIFYLNSLSNFTQKDFFVGYLATVLYTAMIKRGELDGLLFLDEVKDFLPPTNKKTISKEPLLRLLEQGRKFKLKMLLSTQSPSKIHSSALSECNTRFYGLLTVQKDLDKLSDFVTPDVLGDIAALKSNHFIASSPNWEESFQFKSRWLYSYHGSPYTEQHIAEEGLISEEFRNYFPSPPTPARDENEKQEVYTGPEPPIYEPLPPQDSVEGLSDPELDEVEEPSGQEAEEEYRFEAETLPIDAYALDEVLNVQHVLIFNYDGITLFNKDTGQTKIDSLLITGLLRAITVMLKEVHKVKPMRDRLEIKKIGSYRDEHGFLIYLCEGKSVAVALFLDRTAGSIMQRRIKELVYAFEEEFADEINAFVGNVAVFRPAIHLLERYLGISYLEPFIVSGKYRNDPVAFDPVNEQILRVAQRLGGELAREEGFYLQELVNEAFRKIRIPYFDLLGRIVSLTEHSIVKPIRGHICPHSPPFVFAEDTLSDETGALELFPATPHTSQQEEHEELVSEDDDKEVVPQDRFDTISELESTEEPYRTLQDSYDEEEEDDGEDVNLESHPWLSNLLKCALDAGIPSAPLSVVQMALRREIEYDDSYGRLKLQFGEVMSPNKLSSLRVLRCQVDHALTNAFNGPKYVLRNPDNDSTVVMSAVQVEQGRYLVLGFA